MIPKTGIPTVSALGLDNKDPKAIAAKVQGMFLEVMLKSMEDSVGAEDGLFGGSAGSEIYRGMFREQLASAIGAQMDSPMQRQLEQGLSEAKSQESLPAANSLPVSGVITSEKGWRHDPFTGEKRFHKGIDIAAPAGSQVNAVEEGTVVESGAKGSFGNAVVIETNDGRRMLYAHNQQNFVRVGDRVLRGAAIASVGSTGRATGPHVHFEVLD